MFPNFPAPHGMCYLWDPAFIALFVTVNAVIGISYFYIGLKCFEVYRHREKIDWKEVTQSGWIARLFAAFIVLCGITHFFEIDTVFRTDFVFSLVVSLVLSVISLYTALAINIVSTMKKWDYELRISDLPNKPAK